MTPLSLKLAIVGSRTFTDYNKLEAVVDLLTVHHGFVLKEIVSGGARGADSLAEEYAHNYTIPIKKFLADWNGYGKQAGFIRNKKIIDYCDICLAFWDGNSKGTRHDIDLCRKMKKPCYIYNFLTNHLTKI